MVANSEGAWSGSEEMEFIELEFVMDVRAVGLYG
jgi:hypothetical protein